MSFQSHIIGRNPETIIDNFEGEGFKDVQNTNPTNKDELLDLFPPTKETTPVISQPIDTDYTNLAPAAFIIDPNDSNKFIYYNGEFKGNNSIDSRIAAYTGNIAYPLTMSRHGVVLSKGTSGDDDDDGARFGSIIDISGTLYHYYSGQKTTGDQKVMCATGTDGFNWTKQGTVLTPDNINSWFFTDPYVIIDGSTLLMYVTEKASNKRPTLGIALYTTSISTPLSGWTRQDTVIEMGTGNEFDGKYIESATALKLGNDYILLYTTTSEGNLWHIGYAYAKNPEGPFTKIEYPVFSHGSSNFDNRSVAVGLLAEYQTGKWIYYYQASSQEQPASDWDIGAALLGDRVEKIPLGWNLRNNWGGDAFFDIQTNNVIKGSRTLQAVDNTKGGDNNDEDVAPVYIEKRFESRKYIKIKLLCDDVTPDVFIGGFYLYNDNNIITGVMFRNSELKYLDSSGWITAESALNNTVYNIKIRFNSNDYSALYINNVSIVTFQNFTSGEANKIRLEKPSATTSNVYYDEFISGNQ